MGLFFDKKVLLHYKAGLKWGIDLTGYSIFGQVFFMVGKITDFGIEGLHTPPNFPVGVAPPCFNHWILPAKLINVQNMCYLQPHLS